MLILLPLYEFIKSEFVKGSKKSSKGRGEVARLWEYDIHVRFELCNCFDKKMKLLGLHTHVVYLIIIIFFQLNWTIKHVSIVVSPLKSLMADQVADLQNFNVSAIAIEPGTSPETIRGKQIISILTYSPIDDK